MQTFEAVGRPGVVRIEEGDAGTARFADAAIARCADAFVLLLDDTDAGVPDGVCDGEAVIVRAIVDQDEFEPVERLAPHALDGA